MLYGHVETLEERIEQFRSGAVREPLKGLLDRAGRRDLALQGNAHPPGSASGRCDSRQRYGNDNDNNHARCPANTHSRSLKVVRAGHVGNGIRAPAYLTSTNSTGVPVIDIFTIR